MGKVRDGLRATQDMVAATKEDYGGQVRRRHGGRDQDAKGGRVLEAKGGRVNECGLRAINRKAHLRQFIEVPARHFTRHVLQRITLPDTWGALVQAGADPTSTLDAVAAVTE